MPSNYAHYRFGCLALKRLSPELQRSVGRFRQLYDVGQHGPDPFFFYNPFWKNPVHQLGKTFHAQTGREFFTNACLELKKDPSEGAKVYLYGLLGHYCLDSHCHPYVWEKHNAGQVRHAELETDFERFLLRKDGKLPPHLQRVTNHVRLTRGECVTAARFFPPATPAQISRSVKNLALYSRLLTHKNRKALEAVLKLTNENVRDHVMGTKPNPRCEALHPELMALYDRALENYSNMLTQLNDHITDGVPLGTDFDPIFG